MIKNYLNLVFWVLTAVPGAMAQAALSPAGAPTELNAVHADDDQLADPPEQRINLITLPVNVESMEGVFPLVSVSHLLIDPNPAEIKQLAWLFASRNSLV